MRHRDTPGSAPLASAVLSAGGLHTRRAQDRGQGHFPGTAVTGLAPNVPPGGSPSPCRVAVTPLPAGRTHRGTSAPLPAPATISLTVRTVQDLDGPRAEMSDLSCCFQDVWWTRVFTDLSHCPVCFTTFPSTSGKQIQKASLPLDRLSSASSPLQSLAASREKLQHVCVHACTRLHTHRTKYFSLPQKRWRRSGERAGRDAGSSAPGLRHLLSGRCPLLALQQNNPQLWSTTDRKGTGSSAPTKIHASREPQNVRDSEFCSPEKKHPQRAEKDCYNYF